MNIGDKVKIKDIHGNRGHGFDTRTGVVVGFDDDPEYPWEVYVDVDRNDSDHTAEQVPFYKDELEVIE